MHACWTRTVRFAAAGPFPTGARAKRSLSAGSWTRPGPRPGRSRVAIETPHGPVVEGLLLAGFAVFAIGPAQIRGSRRRYVSSGAKDDPRDAWMLGRALRADPDLFRQLALEEPLVLQLRERTRTVNELTCQRTRLCHQIRQQLWRYYPQLLAIPRPPQPTHPPLVRRALEQGQNARNGPQAARLHPRQTPQKVRHPATERQRPVGDPARPRTHRRPRNRRGRRPRPRQPLRPGSHHQPTPRPGTRRHPRTAEGVLPGPRRRRTPRRPHHPPLPPRSRGLRPQHSARRSLRAPPTTRLSRAPRPLRSRPRQHPVRQHPSGRSAASPSSTNSATPSITGPASPHNTTPSAKPATAPSVPAATPMAAPSAPSAIGSSPSPAPCSKTAPSTTPSSPETSSPPEPLLPRKKDLQGEPGGTCGKRAPLRRGRRTTAAVAPRFPSPGEIPFPPSAPR